MLRYVLMSIEMLTFLLPFGSFTYLIKLLSHLMFLCENTFLLPFGSFEDPIASTDVVRIILHYATFYSLLGVS